MTTPPPTPDRADLLDLLQERLLESDLKAVASRLGLRYANLGGPHTILDERISTLYEMYEVRHALPTLLAAIHHVRPDIPIPGHPSVRMSRSSHLKPPAPDNVWRTREAVPQQPPRLDRGEHKFYDDDLRDDVRQYFRRLEILIRRLEGVATMSDETTPVINFTARRISRVVNDLEQGMSYLSFHRNKWRVLRANDPVMEQSVDLLTRMRDELHDLNSVLLAATPPTALRRRLRQVEGFVQAADDVCDSLQAVNRQLATGPLPHAELSRLDDHLDTLHIYFERCLAILEELKQESEQAA